MVRKLPERHPSPHATTFPCDNELRPDGVPSPQVPAPAPVFLVEPLALPPGTRCSSAGAELHEKLERLRSLMRSHRLMAEHDYGRTAMARKARSNRASEVKGETSPVPGPRQSPPES